MVQGDADSWTQPERFFDFVTSEGTSCPPKVYNEKSLATLGANVDDSPRKASPFFCYYICDFYHKSFMVKGLRPDDMDRLTMCGMVWIGCHVGLVATNDSTQVALALAFMGLNKKPSIENFKAENALTEVVCYNELHMFFVFCCLGFKSVSASLGAPLPVGA